MGGEEEGEEKPPRTRISIGAMRAFLGGQRRDPPATPPPSPLAEEEQKWIEREAKADRTKAQTEAIRNDTNLREKYAGLIFKLACGSLCALLVIILLHGFRVGGFTLSDSILGATIGGIILEVIGLVAIIVNYLFPRRN